jgi:hypothetical protein
LWRRRADANWKLSVFADEDGIEALSPRIRLLIDLRAEWRALDERIAAFDGLKVRDETRLFDA